MTIRPFKATVGRSRLGRGVDTTQAEFTQSTREGLKDVVANFNAWVLNIDSQSADILLEAFESTFEISQERVPVKTGDLKDSGYLEKTQFRGSGRVDIGYAKGGIPDYAVMVHEIPEYHHEPPTSDKFLQGPLEEDIENIQQRIINGFKVAGGV